MDAVRFGRALGFGARQAAKTVVTAVDAARAENPSKPTQEAAAAASSSSISSSTTSTAISPASRRASTIAAQGAQQARGVQRGFARFRESAVEPAVRLSGVLWLEVTGVFFGIFALSAATAMWRLRAPWHAVLANPRAHTSLIGGTIVFLLFGYFCVSSFVRAKRRERRRG